MADIELVVKIPKEAYKLLKNEGVDWLGAEHILNAAAKGTLLPKGHGGLIDVKEFIKSINDWSDRMNSYEANEEVEITKSLLQAHACVIIEADKEQEDENDI